MSVIVEFTVPDEEFLLGQILADPPGMRIELERLVPTGDSVLPYLWVRGEDHETFEKRVSENEAIGSFRALDRADDWVLYRTEWAGEPCNLLRIIIESDGAISKAAGTVAGRSASAFRIKTPSRRSTTTAWRRTSTSTSSARPR